MRNDGCFWWSAVGLGPEDEALSCSGLHLASRQSLGGSRGLKSNKIRMYCICGCGWL